MNFCADQMNLTRLLEGDDGSTALAGRLAQARQRAKDLEAQVARVTDAMLSDSDAAPLAFIRKARELETQLESEQETIETLEHELATTANNATPAVAEAWAALVQGVEELDYDARTQARQLVADTFSRIVIYRKGFELADTEDSSIGLLLIAKHGNTRLLRIDRKTGAWKAAEDLDASRGIPLPTGTIGG